MTIEQQMIILRDAIMLVIKEWDEVPDFDTYDKCLNMDCAVKRLEELMLEGVK